jgi:hypothetical protein
MVPSLETQYTSLAEALMTERTAWILTLLFGVHAVLATAGYVFALVHLGFSFKLVAVVLAFWFVAAGFYRKASYLRTQRVLSDRADALEELEG